MDEKDKKILKLLQEDGRTNFNKIAEAIQLSNAAVHARIIKLEREEIISGYYVEINLEKIGRDIIALMKVTVDHSKDIPEETIEKILKIPQVFSVMTLTGEWDYHIQIAARNTSDLRQITTNIIKKTIPHMIRSDTSLIMVQRRKPISI